MLYRAAAKTSSEALEADALHFGSDMWSSVAVLVGLVGDRARLCLGGFGGRDRRSALFVCIAGWRLGRRTIDTLTDTAPAGAADKITAASRACPGVVGDRGRARAAGRRRAVRRSRSSASAARCRSTGSRRSRIASSRRCAPTVPRAEVDVTTEPRALDDETVLERVMVIARNRALAVHHVTVHAIGGRLVGLARSRGRRRACRSARRTTSPTGLEDGDPRGARARRSRSRPISSRCSPSTSPGHDAPPHAIAAVRDALDRDRRQGRLASATCTTCACAQPATARSSISTACVDPALHVADVHEQVDDVERALRLRFPTIKRVIGHAEPALPCRSQ